MENNIFNIIKTDSGFDFNIDNDIQQFSFDEMNEFRAILMAAIGVAEDMWRRRP